MLQLTVYEAMVSKEKLVDGDLASILKLLTETAYGEHNILIYPDLDSFREIYAHLTKARIENQNDLVMLLPHYESQRSVKEFLSEMEIDLDEHTKKGSIEVLDSQYAFFDSQHDFMSLVKGSLKRALKNQKSGVIVIADMGAFYHRGAVDEMINHECKIPSLDKDLQYTILCCYHSKDFRKLSKTDEERLCQNHYHNLFIREENSTR